MFGELIPYLLPCPRCQLEHTMARSVCHPAHKASVNSTRTRVIHQTVLCSCYTSAWLPLETRLKIFYSLQRGLAVTKHRGGNASFRGHSLPPQRRCKGPTYLLVVTSLASCCPVRCIPWEMALLSCGPSLYHGQETVSLLCQRMRECFSLKNTTFPPFPRH